MGRHASGIRCGPLCRRPVRHEGRVLHLFALALFINSKQALTVLDARKRGSRKMDTAYCFSCPYGVCNGRDE